MPRVHTHGRCNVATSITRITKPITLWPDNFLFEVMLKTLREIYGEIGTNTVQQYPTIEMWTWKTTVENQDSVDWFRMLVNDAPPTHAPRDCFPGLTPGTMIHFESDFIYAAHDDAKRDLRKYLGKVNAKQKVNPEHYVTWARFEGPGEKPYAYEPYQPHLEADTSPAEGQPVETLRPFRTPGPPSE